MGARTRSRNIGLFYTGNVKRYATATGALLGTLNGTTVVPEYERNQDVTMAPPYITPHPLYIYKRTADPLILNGRIEGGSVYEEWNGYAPVNRASHAYAPAMTGTIPWNSLKTKAMALMNPSKPSVDLPVFLFELKDFPRMLKQLGDVLSRKAKASDFAGGYVAYSFGWAPLIGDLAKLLDLTKLIDDRARQLKRLEDRKSLRKALGLHGPFTGSPTSYAVANWTIAGDLPFMAMRTIREEGKYWATGKVNLVGSLPSGYDEKRQLAAKAALGLNLSAASLWEAMPWSWLIDYLGNVGDILDAQRGYIPVTYKDICVMATVKVESKFSGIKCREGITYSGGELKQVYKFRQVYIAPSPTFSFRQFLTNHQMGILGSLASAAALRRFGK